MNQKPVIAVKKVSSKPLMDYEVLVTPDDLKSLRRELSESLSEFGLTLRRAIEPKAERGYSRQYISRLEHGKDVITPEIKGAFLSIAATFDGAPAAVGGAVEATVLAAPGQVPEGTFIPANAQVVKCARPGCPIRFVKTNYFMKYHDPACRKRGS